MVKTLISTDEKTGEKAIEIDKRTLSKVDNPPNVKHLRYSRVLPPECNTCPYRPMEDGGNGICTVYEKDSVCIIRKDFAKLVDKFDGVRNADKVLLLMQHEFEDNSEKLAFFKQIEDMSGELDPEVTKRINALNNVAKSLTEMRTRRETLEVKQTETLSDDQKHEIAKVIRVTKSEVVNES